jgi:hypothetical protein
MCRNSVGYKNRDLKTAEVVASGTKQKTEAFCFFCKKLAFVLWGLSWYSFTNYFRVSTCV